MLNSKFQVKSVVSLFLALKSPPPKLDRCYTGHDHVTPILKQLNWFPKIGSFLFVML